MENNLQITLFIGYFAVPFSSTLACARKTNVDSLIFSTNSEACVTKFRTISSHQTERISALDEFDLHIHSVQHVTFLKENIAVDATDDVEFAILFYEVVSRLQTPIQLIVCICYLLPLTVSSAIDRTCLFLEQFACQLQLLGIFAITE